MATLIRLAAWFLSMSIPPLSSYTVPRIGLGRVRKYVTAPTSGSCTGRGAVVGLNVCFPGVGSVCANTTRGVTVVIVPRADPELNRPPPRAFPVLPYTANAITPDVPTSNEVQLRNACRELVDIAAIAITAPATAAICTARFIYYHTAQNHIVAPGGECCRYGSACSDCTARDFILSTHPDAATTFSSGT